MNLSTKRLFAFSLILNFLIFGYFIGQISFPSKNEMNSYELHHRDYKKKSNQLKQELLEILVADDFNQELFRQKATELRYERSKMMDNLAAELEKIALKSDLEQRKELAENLDKLEAEILNTVKEIETIKTVETIEKIVPKTITKKETLVIEKPVNKEELKSIIEETVKEAMPTPHPRPKLRRKIKKRIESRMEKEKTQSGLFQVKLGEGKDLPSEPQVKHDQEQPIVVQDTVLPTAVRQENFQDNSNFDHSRPPYPPPHQRGEFENGRPPELFGDRPPHPPRRF